MPDDLMPDRITVNTSDGRTFKNVTAYVQGNKVVTERTDIPLQPGDRIMLTTPDGIETFIVEDPGFHGGGSTPDTYQMRVRRT